MNKKALIAIAIAAVIIIAVGAVIVASGKMNKELSPDSTVQSTADPFKTTEKSEVSSPVSERNNRISASITSGEAVFTYDGSPIELEYEFTCQRACKMGLVIYLNGILQPYSVDGTVTDMYTVELGDEDVKTFKFNFTPVCGKVGDELSIWFTNIYNPTVLELEGEINTFGNNQKLSQANPKTVKFTTDSPESTFNAATDYETLKMTESEIANFSRTSNDGTAYSTLDGTCLIEIRKDGEALSGKAGLEKENIENLSLYIYGNAEGKYKVYLFGDFEVLGVNGKDFAEVEVKKNEYTVIQLSKNDEKLLNCKNIFAVVAPEDSQNFVSKSSSLYIKGK